MGNGQEFGGSNDYGQVPYHSSLDITDAVTVAAWVKPASEHNGGILEKTVGGTVNTQYLFFLNSGSGTRFRVHRGSTNYTATSDSYPSTTGWTYVVGRYDGSEVSVWVNGEKQPTTAAVASPIASGNGVTLIGHLGSSVYPFNGVLEVADGESAGAHSAYEGRCASYTEPDPPDLTPAGDPYAGPPADPPAVPPVADITEPFSGYKTVLQLCL
jgi:hypothetical protein